jgi:hypothetical protein
LWSRRQDVLSHRTANARPAARLCRTRGTRPQSLQLLRFSFLLSGLDDHFASSVRAPSYVAQKVASAGDVCARDNGSSFQLSHSAQRGVAPRVKLLMLARDCELWSLK